MGEHFRHDKTSTSKGQGTTEPESNNTGSFFLFHHTTERGRSNRLFTGKRLVGLGIIRRRWHMGSAPVILVFRHGPGMETTQALKCLPAFFFFRRHGLQRGINS